MAFTEARRVLLGLVIMTLLVTMPVLGADYRVQVFMPLTGQEAAPVTQTSQWKQVASLAAQEVTSSWNDGDNLIVEYLDTASSTLKTVELGLMAANDPTVKAVVTVAMRPELVHELSRLLHFYNITLLSIDTTEADEDDQVSDNFASLICHHYDAAHIILSMMNYHSWTRATILHDEEFEHAVEIIEAAPGIETTPIHLADWTKSEFEQIIKTGAAVTFFITRNTTRAVQLMEDAENLHSMYDKGNAWIVVGLELDELEVLPTFPVGTLFVRTLEVPPGNVTSFSALVKSLPGGPAWPVEHNTARMYDSIKLIGSAILANKPSVSSLAVMNSIMNVHYYGVEGLISFDDEGFRSGIYADVLNSVPVSFASSGVTSVLNWDGRSFTSNGTNPTVFPGVSTDVPSSVVETYNIAWMLQMALYYDLPQETLAAFIHYASDAVNGNINVTFPVPKMPVGHRLRVSTVDLGVTAATAIPSAIPASSFGILGVLTDCDSSLTALLQNILSPYNIVQLSAAATSPTLSDRSRYPTFLRNVPPDDFQGSAILDLAQKLGWTELSIIYTNDAYGTGIFQVVQEQAFARGVSLSAVASIEVGGNGYASHLRSFIESKPRIVVLLVSLEETLGPLLKTFKELGHQPSAFVGSDAITFAFNAPQTYGIEASDLNGILATAPSGGFGPAYDAFLAEVSAMPPTAALRQYFELAGSYAVLILDTVFNFADAMARVIRAGQSPRNSTTLLNAMLSTDAVFLTGRTKFNDGDRIGAYDLINVVNGAPKTIGRLSEGGVQIESPAIWPDGTQNIPLSTLPRTQKWLAWRDPAAIIFTILSILGMLTCVIMFGVLVWQRNSAVVKVATWEFLLVMVFGAALGFGSMLTWIGKPQPYICALRIWLPPMAFILIMAPLLTKTWRLHKIFTLQDLRVQPIPLWRLVVMCIFLGIIQFVICIFWISLGTFKTVVINDANDKSIAYIQCGSNKANRIASYVTYGYLGLLMLIGCYLTFRVRKLPKDFNESRWIGFSIYNTLLFSVIILILGYALAKFPVTVLILICVCTLAICTGAMCFMMAPKLWTLLMHPEKRSSSSSSSMKQGVPAVPSLPAKRHNFTRTPKGSKESKSSKDRSNDSKESSKESRVATNEL